MLRPMTTAVLMRNRSFAVLYRSKCFEKTSGARERIITRISVRMSDQRSTANHEVNLAILAPGKAMPASKENFLAK